MKKIKIIIAGADGRMGKRITALALENPSIELVGLCDIQDKLKDLLDLYANTKIRIASDLDSIIEYADVVIDFTSSEATFQNIGACNKKRIAMVIGTTGQSDDEKSAIKAASERIPIVFAPNMSVGVNLLLKVLADIAKVTGDDYDVEISETHHKHKKDAPSGTAMKMAQVIAVVLNRNLEETAVYSRHGQIGERSKEEIGIQTHRIGDVVGEHTVTFGGIGERIEITHKASSRDTFARGALRAALWVHDKGPGLYDMQDVLGLK